MELIGSELVIDGPHGCACALLLAADARAASAVLAADMFCAFIADSDACGLTSPLVLNAPPLNVSGWYSERYGFAAPGSSFPIPPIWLLSIGVCDV